MTATTPMATPGQVQVTLPGVWDEVAPGWFVWKYNGGQHFIEARVSANNPLVRFQAKAAEQFPGVASAAQLVAEETAPWTDEAAVSLAIARLLFRLGTTAKTIADKYPRGRMPLETVQLLYDLRQVEYEVHSTMETITLSDLQALERGVRFMVACELFARCDEQARTALLHDKHHSVRSAAIISQHSM